MKLLTLSKILTLISFITLATAISAYPASEKEIAGSCAIARRRLPAMTALKTSLRMTVV